MANVYQALEINHEVIPILNKIDLPASDVEKTKNEIEDVVGIDTANAIPCSGKTGEGIDEILEAIINKLPAPNGDIDEKLKDEFTDQEKKEWQLEIIPEENLIRFNAPDVMFSKSNFELSDRFKTIINAFFPRYIKVLSKFDSLVSEIRIEGHTSSEWKDENNQIAYIKNMVLSQERTISVLNESLNSLTKFNLCQKLE